MLGSGDRLEIQGLRAVAVMAVVLFHAGVSAIPGGFLGVDVFFVISGFLITSNIVRDVDAGVFRFGSFYAKRALRLMPAAATTIVGTLVASFVVLPPNEVIDVAWSSLAALLSASNILFWMSVGYFDTAADLKPLLHTWSLGVEEQFYLIWPLLLFLLIGRPAVLIWVIAGLTLASLALCYVVAPTDASAVFYLLPFRVFELGTGALLAIPGGRLTPSSPVVKSLLTMGGVIAIVGAVTLMDETIQMPSAFSLVPCLGAAAVIVAGRSPISDAILGNRPMTFVGKISYSLYLVHWPVVTLLGAASVDLGVAGIVLLCLVLAVAQFYLVEQPFRRGPEKGLRLSTPIAAAGCAGLVMATSSAAAYGLATDGLKHRLPPELRDIPTAQAMWQQRNSIVRVRSCFLMDDQSLADFDRDLCLAVKEGEKNYLIVGDSFAADLYGALSTAFPEVNFLQATAARCLPFIDNTKSANCEALLRLVFEEYLPRSDLAGVILAGGWGYHFEQIERTLDFLEGRGVPVILVGPPVMFMKNVPTLIFESRALSRATAEHFAFNNRHPGNGANPHIRKRFSDRVRFIDLLDIMCSPRCELFTEEGELIFIDFGHLTANGIRYLGEKLKDPLSRVL